MHHTPIGCALNVHQIVKSNKHLLAIERRINIILLPFGFRRQGETAKVTESKVNDIKRQFNLVANDLL